MVAMTRSGVTYPPIEVPALPIDSPVRLKHVGSHLVLPDLLPLPYCDPPKAAFHCRLEGVRGLRAVVHRPKLLPYRRSHGTEVKATTKMRLQDKSGFSVSKDLAARQAAAGATAASQKITPPKTFGGKGKQRQGQGVPRPVPGVRSQTQMAADVMVQMAHPAAGTMYENEKPNRPADERRGLALGFARDLHAPLQPSQGNSQEEPEAKWAHPHPEHSASGQENAENYEQEQEPVGASGYPKDFKRLVQKHHAATKDTFQDLMDTPGEDDDIEEGTEGLEREEDVAAKAEATMQANDGGWASVLSTPPWGGGWRGRL
ncbi:hypothetical protein CVIRNUC_000218 [Coccomyxa viridis]|uniref:Uncharacterized protein n=1 Tax=Coccomyxa viridis TaxID=1274662 RepID=A0AAV1HQA7_9CHLO|nr:hypothetical protein CVIRNUC_000218 [Coccomyxa viridis]